MHTTTVRISAFVLAGMAGATSLPAQSPHPRRTAEIPSLGQPRQWGPYLVPAGLRGRPGGDWIETLALGVHRPVTNPVIGLFGVAGEAYGTGISRPGFGGRLLATTRMLGLAAGVDWFEPTGEVDAILSFQTAVRRGGLLGRGTMLRADWLPGRGDALALGLHVPFGQPLAGRTRPRDTDVDAPAENRMPLATGRAPAGAETALARVAEAAGQLIEYTNLYPGERGAVNYGPSYAAATRAYTGALAEAFRVAASNALVGDGIAARARRGLLDHVIIPYDSLFGQVKARQGSIRWLTSAAQGSFVQWLRDSSRVAASAQPGLAAVHARWLTIIERVHRVLLRQAHDSRLVWLPLQLALTDAQYDEQREVDALIERAVGRPFTDRNALAYLRSSDIPLEIARSIFAARDYHVLWTHDFAGQRDDTKSLDEISYAMVADAYLPALTQAIQRYDSTRLLPVYMLMLDQFYYERRNGRLWMDILENPLHARIKLQGSNAEKEAHLRRRQHELRDAVATSWRLQQDATANGGDRWLPDVVRVNVSILLPSDWSFRSHQIVPPWPFVADNVMRDHRTMAFYDLTEADPYRGATIVMGVGVGEHYSSATWEDRGYRVRGPAAIEARDAARRALLANGLAESDIPFPLRRATGLQPSAASLEYVGRALQLHNEAGFGAKESSVARAMLYNLAPAGSVIIVPDPIWVSDTWAGMLAAAAARGCRVYIIAPSHDNNPNPHVPIEAVEHDVMWRLLQSRDRMREQMRLTGGELRVGLYTGRAQITDVAGRTGEVRNGLRRYPWIREVIPFDDATLAVLTRATVLSESDGADATDVAKDETPRWPKLHQTTQLVARPGAIAALVRQPGWEDVLARAMRTQSQQASRFADQLGFRTLDVDTSATRSTDALLRGYEQGLSETDRKAFSFYFSVGMQNQDPRGIMMDGEATVLVSGLHAAAGVVDLYYLMARTTWLESKADLDRLLPRPRGLLARLARTIRFAL